MIFKENLAVSNLIGAVFSFASKVENYYKKVLTGWPGYAAKLEYKHVSRRFLMADTFLSDLKLTLDNCIAELDSIHSLFCQNPERDFTRNRKITFSDAIHFMIEFQSKSLPNEVLDYFGHTLAAPSASAYYLQKFYIRDRMRYSLSRICESS